METIEHRFFLRLGQDRENRYLEAWLSLVKDSYYRILLTLLSFSLGFAILLHSFIA